jgi:D-arabinose 1-dehydrogenase-like Zn-dependent alcohol dehydrogenase
MSKKMMRAAVLAAPGQVAIEQVELPEPGAGQVRLRLEGCGVCASNLTPWEGPEWMTFPTEPGSLGHEGWGVVDAVGEGVRALQPGTGSRRSPTNPTANMTSRTPTRW